MREYQMLFRNPVENIIALPDKKDILTWHYMIYNLKDTPYEGGEYLGNIFFPQDYPFSPP